ncbi:MAG TPA: exodeoxyribonuclease V subunit gamma, partial [Solirubrobacteraceae bacterium]|nr:exodeoxyribonuclease V subunit gamma [Solirubrobacteraceae bacterium]
ERIADACAALRTEPGLVDLPGRVSLFGLTRLPAAQLDVLAALAAHRDVHLFLLHPSPALWAQVVERLGPLDRIPRRADDPTATLPRNRLLATWGHDARELQVVLAAGAGGAVEVADHHHPGAAEHAPRTLLQRIQADVVADAPPPGIPLPGRPDERAALDPVDRSVQVHACHGRARQVEVLRDAILHLLDEDPTLEPRDVIVMCPDIETFAPLIHATFGAGQVGDEDDDATPDQPQATTPDLRVRLADRSLRQTNPVLGVIAQLVDLAERRLTASEVLDLADREPVRRRFHLDDDDLARMEDWVASSGIRWGLDAPHRKPFKLDALDAGTWRAGLDRVLTGVTMTEDDRRLLAGAVLPHDDVDSGAIDLAGRFAELVDRLGAALTRLQRAQPIGDWAAALAGAADALTATTNREGWQRAELQRILDDVVREATAAGPDGGPGAPAGTHLTLAEIRALLSDRLQGRPTRANFRTGHLTICTLMPMRSVPHRVVCLLGLDDAVFPRRAPRDGDDLILEDPHVGDRDARSEDRQLLLDALLAATDRLLVTYTGNDERTNAERPPAVPIGELLDVVDRTVRTADGAAPRDRVVTRHPLQPFDPRNFMHGELAPDAAWSFDRVTLDGARALIEPRSGKRRFLADPLPPREGDLIEIEEVVKFAERPVRAFLRQRLGISLGDPEDEIEDALPIELDPLELWGVGDRLLRARLAGTEEDRAVAAEIARGALPPGALAQPVLDRVRPIVDRIASASDAAFGAAAEPTSVDVKLRLRDGRSLSGTVPGVCGTTLRFVTYSRVSPRHRLASYVRWLALTAADPERPYEAVVLGRARRDAERGSDVTVARLAVLHPDPDERRAMALTQLESLVDVYDRGMREPLPLPCLAAAAYANAALNATGDPTVAGKGEWESGWQFPREDREPEHELVLGGVPTFAELLALAPRPDEAGEGWDERDPTRLGRYALKLWSGLLRCEDLIDR